MSLKWNGDEVEAKASRAIRWGIDKTMSECVRSAKAQLYPGHGYVFGILQGSIQMRPAVALSTGVAGRWGSFDVEYARFIEEGSGRFPGYGYLGSSTDAEYPKLAGRIAQAMGF